MNIKNFWSSKFIFNSYKYEKVVALALVLWILGGMKIQAQTANGNEPEVKNPELPEVVIKEVPIIKILELTQPLINTEPAKTLELPQNIFKEVPTVKDLQLPINLNFLITPLEFINPELMAPETPQDKQGS